MATNLSCQTKADSLTQQTVYVVLFDIPTVVPTGSSPYYSFTSLADGSIGYERIKEHPIGKLVSIRLQPAGTSSNFSFEIGNKDEFTTSSINTVFLADQISSTGLYQSDLNAYFTSWEGAVNKLYLKVVNSDAVNATGVISVELLIMGY